MVDEDYQLEKILKIKDKLPNLKAIVKTLPSEKAYEGVMSWKELEELNTDDYNEEYEKIVKGIKANSCCCLIFTSGTTGNSYILRQQIYRSIISCTALLNALIMSQYSKTLKNFLSYYLRQSKRRNDESRQRNFQCQKHH